MYYLGIDKQNIMEYTLNMTIEKTLLNMYGKIRGFGGLVRYCIDNNILSHDCIPVCKAIGCENKVTYNREYPNRGFADFCGPVCSRKSKTVSDEVLSKISDRDWLYNQRIVLKKSKDKIAEELGVSITPINKWIKIHNIPSVKYNESNHSIKKKLNDKNLIENLYDSGNTQEEIAKNLGCSKATVSLFMKKHGIETKDPNSYDRNPSYVSSGELEVVTFIKSLGVTNIVTTNRNVISKELDIYLPDYNFAIEYNGVYWHQEQFKSKNSHLEKTELCVEKNIFLLHLWEDDWKYNTEIMKSFIKNKLGFTDKKIYARKCKIEYLDHKDTKVFLDENHIQGYCQASIRIGLYHENKLVAVMTFNKPRFNKKYEWELVRYATTINTNVVGGFSKLLSYFRSNYQGMIVSYADRCYSNGNVYINNGFSLISTNIPSYWYVIGDKKVSRTMFTKTKLKDFDQNMSEREITKELGIGKIWNCGTYTFVI